MPCLRSQTRASLSDTSTDSDKVISTRISTVSAKPTISNKRMSPVVSTTHSMFPFPPAPVLPVKSQANLKSNIINISNISSEASICSEVSSLSNSAATSHPSSPNLENQLLAPNLNDVMILKPKNNVMVSINNPVLKPDGHISPSLNKLKTVPNSLPAMLQHSLMLSTKSMVYIPVVEHPSIQEDRDRSLQMILSQHECYDDEAGMNLRRKIIYELDTLVKQWIRSEGLRQSMNWNQVEQVGGKVVSYGSYKLLVVDKVSDLDLLCVVPKHVTREDFFKNLYDLLMKKEEVTELRQLAWAYVPVIKMKFRGVEIDLTMARLMMTKIPEDEEMLQTPQITKDLDQKCLRSLNGYRATCEILQLVPSVEKFRLTLRVIKLWARKNGIYGNMLGYLGGASWAIMVAKVCQLAGVEGSQGSSVNLIHRFFHTFAYWNWPEPVYIKKVGVQSHLDWNPAMNHFDREHAMPIITSSIPQMNSAVNITKTVCQLITAKCEEALAICQTIIEGRRPWSDLFNPVNFFEEFDHFILISGSCRGDSCLWFGSVESKLRQLNVRISSCSKVSSARVWPQPFIKREGAGIRQMWFFGVKMMVGHSPETIQEPLHVFIDLNMGTAHKLSSPFASTFSLDWKHVSRSQLKKYVSSLDLGLEKPEKLSYAAVTFGQGSTMTSPVVITSMQSVTGYVNSNPVPSPSSQGDMLHLPPTPLTRMFPTPLPSLGHNYMIYSLAAPMSSHIPQGHVLAADHPNYTHPSHHQLQHHPRPLNQLVATFHPPNRSNPHSPQPGGNPTTQPMGADPYHRHNRVHPGHIKSPQTPVHQLPTKPRASPQYPPPRPSSAHQDGNVFLPVPALTSYPPPPFSPISQFSSPPPPVQKQVLPPPPRTDCSCSSQGDVPSAQANRIDKRFNKVRFCSLILIQSKY